MINVAIVASLLIGHSSPPQDDFGAVWDKTRKSIESRYYARQSKAEKMKRLLDEAEPKAKSATSRSQFSDVVNEMIDKFGDSHFDLLTPADQGYYVLGTFVGVTTKLPQIGAWFGRDSKGWFVQMLLNGGTAEKAGIKKGDRIKSVDGKELHPVESFRAKVEVKVQVWRDGKEKEFTVSPSDTGGMDMFVQATRSSGKIMDIDGKKIAYFRVWTMGTDEFRSALNGFVNSRLSGTSAMILDLRDGFGGRPEGFLDGFYRPAVTLEWGFSPTQTMKQELGYDKPLVVLINEGTRSAKEVASYILKKTKRGVMVGKNTAGHVLGTSPIVLNDWAILEIPMVTLKTDGKDLEGSGVEPDVLVPVEIGNDGEDLIYKRGLEEAVKLAKKA